MSPPFRDAVLGRLAALGPVDARAMFGGGGLYLDGTMFAIVADDVLYFKTDDGNRGDYEGAGMGPFVPFADRPYAMSYHQVPAEIIADGEALCAWARRAWEAARRAKRSRKPRKRGRRR